MKIRKEALLNILGWTLVVLATARIISLFVFSEPVHIFWLCNHAPLIIGIAILKRNSFWLIAETSLLFFGSLNWSLDFLSKVFFGKYLLGSTYYIFTAVSAESTISILLHLSTLPLAILGIFLICKPETNAWKASFLHAALLIPAAVYFGKFYNLNCLLKSCVSWIPRFDFYPVVFFIIYIAVFVYPVNWVINRLLKK